mgnify:CR=1 FL=1
MVLQDSKLFGNLVSWNGELNEISAEVRLFARKFLCSKLTCKF